MGRTGIVHRSGRAVPDRRPGEPFLPSQPHVLSALWRMCNMVGADPVSGSRSQPAQGKTMYMPRLVLLDLKGSLGGGLGGTLLFCFALEHTVP